MKKSVLSMIASATLLIASQASAQESLVDYLITSCEAELSSFCSTVHPGEGRLLHCMAAHEDQLSGQCEYALYRAATLIEQTAAAMSYLISQCEVDVETHCSGVAMGEGRLLVCLDEHSESISNGCKKAISDTISE